MDEGIRIITELSNEYGVNMYVKGGGGNTSVKNDDTLWIKPSGTTLATIGAENFVALDRKAMEKLAEVDASVPENEREAVVLEIMTGANTTPDRGRPSVEAPVHNLFKATYVVHTHPTMVNGLTSSVNGKEKAKELFPESVWLDYIDPGFTLYRAMEKVIQDYVDDKGKQPDIIFMKNHGVFVAGNTPEEIRDLYDVIMGTLKTCYDNDANFAYQRLPIEPLDFNADEADLVNALAAENGFGTVSVHSPFPLPAGPISPDHIVYMKAYPYEGEVTREALQAFVDTRDYFPKVIGGAGAVYVLGTSQKDVMLTTEIVLDASQIMGLAPTFGGIDLMTERAMLFIENWEVEAYRRKQAK